MKYTENDFKNARFATHPDGRFAARVDPADSIPWAVSEHDADNGWWNDAEMVEGGWVPGLIVTETELTQAAHAQCFDSVGPSTRAVMTRLGLSIIPDPEPTNAQKILADLDGLNRDGFLIHNRHKEKIANHLANLGWAKVSEGEK